VNEQEYRDAAILADEAGRLFGLGKDRFLRSVACLPTFPEPVGLRPKAWIRGEVLDWRENHRAERLAA